MTQSYARFDKSIVFERSTQQHFEEDNNNRGGRIPDEFVCPLTGKVMIAPLMTPTGLNFEKSAILDWLFENNEYNNNDDLESRNSTNNTNANQMTAKKEDRVT